ncbi:hypothetical protein [Mesorhizobium sp. M1329]
MAIWALLGFIAPDRTFPARLETFGEDCFFDMIFSMKGLSFPQGSSRRKR